MNRNPLILTRQDSDRRAQVQARTAAEASEQGASAAAAQKAGFHDEDGKLVPYGLTGITPLSGFWVG